MRRKSLIREIAEKMKELEAKLHERRSHNLRVIRAPLDHPDSDEGESLDIRGYAQLDSYSCGVVAGWTVLKALHPQAVFKDFYLRCPPSPEDGLQDGSLLKALRASGVGVSTKMNGMTFEQIMKAISQGFPILTIVDRPGTDSAHWVVIYGYAIKRTGRQHLVYLANNGFMGIKVGDRGGPHSVPYTQYKKLSKGFSAYVCWGKSVRMACH